MSAWPSRTPSSSAGGTWKPSVWMVSRGLLSHLPYFSPRRENGWARLTVLDELLETVRHVKVAPFVYVANVARLEPAVGAESVLGELGSVQVTRKHVGTLKPDFTFL